MESCEYHVYSYYVCVNLTCLLQAFIYSVLTISFVCYKLFFVDNVCIESMSVKISKRTLDRCQQNLEKLGDHIKRYITQHFSSFIYFTDTKIDMDNIYKQNYESWQFKFFFIKELKTSK